MRLNNRIKKLEDLTGINASDYPEVVIVSFTHRDDEGALHSQPGYAVFIGRDCDNLPAHDGETETQFRTRAHAHLEHLKQTKEART